MSDSPVILSPTVLAPSVSTLGGSVQVVQVIVPISTGTVAEALREIRGAVPGARNTLELLSDALDATARDVVAKARAQARAAAIVFG